MISNETKDEIKNLFINQNWTADQIAIKFGFSRTKVYNIIRRMGVQKYSRTEFNVGDLFANGNLEIVDIVDSVQEANGSQRQVYRVLCKLCGSVSDIRRSNLVQPTRRCCSNCMKAGECNTLWRGYKDISLTFFHDIKNGAIGRNFSFEITIEDVWDLYEKQNRKCALSGVDIHFDVETPDWKGRKPTASLDRIDSNLGYTTDNIQWVHYDINYMKLDFTQKELIEWCKLVQKHNNGLSEYNNDQELVIRDHHKNWRGYGNLSRFLYGGYASGAADRGHEFNVSIEYLWDLFVSQKGLCALSGLPIYFPKKHKDSKSASLDRIDSLQGYIEGNLQWIHKDLNFMKHKLTQENFKDYCCLIAQKNRTCIL